MAPILKLLLLISSDTDAAPARPEPRRGFNMSKRPPPWFWNGTVLARLAVMLLSVVIVAYAVRLVANIYWPFH